MNISIKVEASAGSDVGEIINDQCALANRMNVRVDCNLNGVTVMAQPLCNPAALYALWSNEVNSDSRHKIVCGHPVVENAVSELTRYRNTAKPGADHGK